MAEERDQSKATGESGETAFQASAESEEGRRAAEEAQRTGQEAREQLRGAREGARHRMESMKDRVRQSTQGLTEEARRRTRELTEQARSQGQQYLEQGKGQAVEQVEHVSHAFRSAGEKLREERHETVACYVDAVADQIDSVTGYLRDRDAMDLLNDAANTARRHPVLLMSGAFVAGLALARFLKANREQERRRAGSGEAGSTYGGAGSAGEALYEAQSRYGQSNLPVGATQNQPTERYQPFQSRGMTSVTTADPTTPSSPAPSTMRTPESGPDQPIPSKTPESLNP